MAQSVSEESILRTPVAQSMKSSMIRSLEATQGQFSDTLGHRKSMVETHESSKFKTLYETPKREQQTFLTEKTPNDLSYQLKALERELSTPSIIEANRFDSEEDEPISKEISALKWCAYCSQEVSTKVQYANSRKTFWSSVAIFLNGGVCGCFMIPYFSNSFKTPQTVCYKCERILS